MKRYEKKQNLLKLKRQVKAFMEYINKFEIPTAKSKIRFSDIGENSKKDSYVYYWFREQLSCNLKLFKELCQEYQEIYPDAYLKIADKITIKENDLSPFQKIEIFMNYIDKIENTIPGNRAGVKFSDISPTTKNNLDVGVWVQDSITLREKEFLRLCEIYKDQYPTAYKKIIQRLKRKNPKESEKERIKLVMKHLEQESKIKESLCFCDIDKNSVDTIKVISWLHYLRMPKEGLSFVNLIEEGQPYQKDYPNGYKRLCDLIYDSEQKRTQRTLTDIQKLEQILKYLNIPSNSLNDTLTFHDIDNTVPDVNIASLWLKRQFEKNIKSFLGKCSCYQNIYPIGYQKILQKQENYLNTKVQKKNKNSNEERLKLLLFYLENNPDIKIPAKLRFCDISKEILDSSIVLNWFYQILSQKQVTFISKLETYRTTYPIGYQKLATLLNNSAHRQRKERIFLINCLKQIKENLSEEPTPKGYSRTKKNIPQKNEIK